MQRAFRRTSAGLAVAGAAILIAGCGGGSDSLSAEELRSQADAICAAADEATAAIPEPTSNEDILPFLIATRDAQTGAVAELKELDPPSELEADWDRAIALQDEQLETINEAITRIEAGEDAEAVITDLSPGLERRDNELDALADDLGLTVCGADDEGGTPPATTDGSTTAATTLGEPTVPAATDTTAPSTGAQGSVDQYLQDAQAAAAALTQFGEILQNVGSADELEAQAPAAQQALDEFDAAIARMDGYTLAIPQIENQRAGLVQEGPAVSDVLRRFVDAAATGDAAAVRELLPEVQSALQAFSRAATDVS
jgi:hypothetical protein